MRGCVSVAPEVENIYYLFVVDAEQPAGRCLEPAPSHHGATGARLRDIMIQNPARVHHTDSRDSVAEIVEKYDLLALPVVDDGDTHRRDDHRRRRRQSHREPGMEAQAGKVRRSGPRALVGRFRGRLRLPPRLALLLAVIGPGIITANVDNDAGGIATYSLAGAQFGYGLLWTLIPITVALVVVQEMCARMGVITGKGLADLIREQYGVKVTFYIMVALLFANLANTVAEFAGVAAALEIFGVSKYISIPIAALFVWWLIVYGTYRRVEKVFLVACLFYVAYLISGIAGAPAVGRGARHDGRARVQLARRLSS